jgi:uncharacterized protein YfaS (alpha-2-macroglobulin family)
MKKLNYVGAMLLVFGGARLSVVLAEEEWEAPVGPVYEEGAARGEAEWLADARTYYEEGSYVWARAAAANYLAAHPTGAARAELECVLVKCNLKLGEYDGALADLEAIMRAYPRSPYALDAADLYVDLFTLQRLPRSRDTWVKSFVRQLGIDWHDEGWSARLEAARRAALALADETYDKYPADVAGADREAVGDRRVYNHLAMMDYLAPDKEEEVARYRFVDDYLASLEEKEMSADMRSALAFYRGLFYMEFYPVDVKARPEEEYETVDKWKAWQRINAAVEQWRRTAAAYPGTLGGTLAAFALAHYQVLIFDEPEEAAAAFEDLASAVASDELKESLAKVAENLRRPALAITGVSSEPWGSPPQLRVDIAAKLYGEVSVAAYPVDPKRYHEITEEVGAVDVYLDDGRKVGPDSARWYDLVGGGKIRPDDLARVAPRPTADLPGVGEAVDTRTVATGYAGDLRIAAASSSFDGLAPGLYVVEVVAPDGNMARTLVLHSKVTALTIDDDHVLYLQLVDTERGAPVPIAALTALTSEPIEGKYGYRGKAFSEVALELREEGDGYLVDMDGLEQEKTVFLILESAEGPAFTSFWTPYRREEERYERPAEDGVLYTDKPLYRPEQTVHYKAVLRRVDYAEKVLAPVPSTKVSLSLEGPEDDEIWTGEGETDEFGALWGSLVLPPGARLGTYHMKAGWSRPEGGKERRYGAYWYFDLEEYEKPEYEISGEAERDRYLSGEKVGLRVTGRYFFGAPMSDCHVAYEITRSGKTDKGRERDVLVKEGEGTTDAEGQVLLSWRTKHAGKYGNRYDVAVKITDPSGHVVKDKYELETYAHDRYVRLTTDKYSYHEGEAIEVSLSTYDWYGEGVSLAVKLRAFEYIWDKEKREGMRGPKLYERRVTTDDEGKARLSVELADPPERVILEAEIEDTAGTKVATSQKVNIVPSAEETVERVAEVDISVDESRPGVGDTVHARVRSRFEGATVGVLFFADGLRGYKNVTLQPDPEGGYSATFPIKIESRYLPELRLRATLIYRQKDYDDGVTVEIQNNGVEMAVAVDVEREEYLPADEKATVRVTTTGPAGAPVVSQLSLAAVDEALLALREDHTYYLPFEFTTVFDRGVEPPYVRDSLGYLGEIETSDYRFFFYERVRCAKVLDEVGGRDKAVEFLERFDLPLAYLTRFERYLDFGYVDKLDVEAYRDVVRRAAEEGVVYTFPSGITGAATGYGSSGGGGGLGGGLGAGRGRLTKTRVSVSAAAPSSASAEGTVASALGAGRVIIGGKTYARARLREYFTDLAYWKPDLVTAEDGAVAAEIELPDNLTDWRVMALAVDKGQRIGWGCDNFNVTKNVIVRVKAPRHLVVGDTTQVRTIAHNYLARKKKVLFLTEADKLELLEGDAEKIKKVKAEGKDFVALRFRATEPGTACVRAFAGTDVESDATAREVPVFPHGVVRHQGFAGRLRDRVSHELTLDEGVDPATFRGEVVVSPALARTLGHGLDFFKNYPYKCVEQTANRFLINALLAEAAGELGLQASPLADGLAEAVEEGVGRLEDQQNDDAGWPWWKGGRTSPYMTAYVLDGLYAIRGNSFVSETAAAKVVAMIDAASPYLRDYLADLKDNGDRYDRELSLYVADVALRHGLVPPDDEVLKDILDYYFESRDPLSDRGLVLLGSVAYYMADEAKLAAVLRNLDNGAQVGPYRTLHWGTDPESCWRWWQDSVETTAKVIELKMLAEPNNPQIPYMVDWLVDQRRGAAWKSTKDSAEATKTLMRYLLAYPEAAGTVEVGYALSERRGILELDARAFEKADEAVELELADFKVGVNEVELTRERGDGPVFYTVAAEYYAEAERFPAVPGSVTIDRRYYRLERSKERGRVVTARTVLEGPLKVGEDVEVEVAIISPYDFDYVIVEDPRPAGCIYTEARSGYRGSLNAYVELRNEKRVVMFERLRRGETTFSYRLRAEVAGDYAALPATVAGMYSPDIGSSTASTRVVVVP